MDSEGQGLFQVNCIYRYSYSSEAYNMGGVKLIDWFHKGHCRGFGTAALQQNLIFVLLHTLTHFEAWKLYTQKCKM